MGGSVFLPFPSREGVSCAKIMKWKVRILMPKKRIKLIERGKHLTISERMKIYEETIGFLKRLGYSEEDFKELLCDEPKESVPAGGK
jgi:hypothetical protein